MKKVLIGLGVLLAATSGFVFFAGRDVERKVDKIPARKAADMLAEAWSDHRTRA